MPLPLRKAKANDVDTFKAFIQAEIDWEVKSQERMAAQKEAAENCQGRRADEEDAEEEEEAEEPRRRASSPSRRPSSRRTTRPTRSCSGMARPGDGHSLASRSRRVTGLPGTTSIISSFAGYHLVVAMTMPQPEQPADGTSQSRMAQSGCTL